KELPIPAGRETAPALPGRSSTTPHRKRAGYAAHRDEPASGDPKSRRTRAGTSPSPAGCRRARAHRASTRNAAARCRQGPRQSRIKSHRARRKIDNRKEQIRKDSDPSYNSLMIKPTEKIWHNGRFINWNDAKIHVLSHVTSYGSSVFEGIRCYATENG